MGTRIPLMHASPHGMGARIPLMRASPRGMGARIAVIRPPARGMGRRIAVIRPPPRGMSAHIKRIRFAAAHDAPFIGEGDSRFTKVAERVAKDGHGFPHRLDARSSTLPRFFGVPVPVQHTGYQHRQCTAYRTEDERKADHVSASAETPPR
jgi:hypothetical protein